MDIKLSTDTDHLRNLVESALDNTPMGRMDPALFTQVTEEVVHMIARQSVAQLGPATFERDVLAAIDRSLTGCLPLQAVYRAATGRDPEGTTAIRTTEQVLDLLIGEGLVARGSGPQGQAGEWFWAMPKGRNALRA